MSEESNNIIRHFLTAAREHPAKTAIIENHKSISYKNLENEVISTAAYFSAKGIRRGDRVMVFVPMSIDLYRSVLALFYIGATAVFLDEWVSKERLLLSCRLSDCTGFIGTRKARFLSFFAKDLRDIPIKLNLNKRKSVNIHPAIVDPQESALITFTTGSTGVPKAADRSHAFLDAQFTILSKKINCKAGDIDMTILPIVLFINLGRGVTSIIADYNGRKPETIKPQNIVQQLRLHKVERLTASPYFIKCIAQELIDSKSPLINLKHIFTGGAPVFPAEAKIYRKALPNTDINIIYGSTEAEPISSITALELIASKELLTSGLPVGDIHPDTELRIIKIDNTPEHNMTIDELDQLSLNETKIGEIIVSGKHVLKRYFNNEKAYKENKIIVNDQIWHRTGDSGFLKNGQLYLTGRCSQLIYSNEQLISPFVVENFLLDIPGVKIGTVLSYQGNICIILETDKQALDIEKDLIKLDYDRLIIVEKIPRDPRHYSKIDYSVLSRMNLGV